MTKRKIIRVTLYLIILFLFFEWSLRFIFLKTNFLDKQIVNGNSGFRLKIIRAYNFNKASSFLPRCIYDPVRGWAFKPNLEDWSAPKNIMFHTNSKGIRGGSEYAYVKSIGKLRIIVLGDSFTAGAEVGDTETYPYYLSQMLPYTEVLNFGVGGYGHDQMLLYLKSEGLKYKPDLVILGFLNMDMERNMLDYRDFPKPRFRLYKGRLESINVPVPSLESVVNRESYRLKILDLFSMLYYKFWDRERGVFESKKKISEAILSEMVQGIRSIGAKPLFVYIFPPRGVSGTANELEKRSECEFLQYCKVNDIPCLSTHSYFRDAISKGISLKKTGHWDAQGNYIVAQAIKDYLLSNKIE